jgi:hypothetical protein
VQHTATSDAYRLSGETSIRMYTQLAKPCTVNSQRRISFLISYTLWNIQGVTGGMCETSGECSLGQTIPI